MVELPAEGLVGQSLGRFAISRCIGVGGMGVVYEATDREHGGRVALKTLSRLEPEAIYDLKREFRSVAGVLHPNLVHMRELSCEGSHWFFVMDYVDGLPFLEFLRGAAHDPAPLDAPTSRVRFASGIPPTEPLFSLSEFNEQAGWNPSASRKSSLRPPRQLLTEEYFGKVRRTFAELLRGVFALHVLGKIHGDLKPSNVLVTKTERVVILDFGLTMDETLIQGSQAKRRPHGTPLYMAPELFLEGGTSRAADFYALGVMLYQALVGEAPFNPAAHRLVAAKLYGEIPPPRAVFGEVPEDLSRLCLELLSREPSERLRGDRVASLLQTVGGAPVSPFRGSSIPPPRFIGRKHELFVLNHAHQDAMFGRANLVLVSGGSGLGKTALVEAFLAGLKSTSDAFVLPSRCYEHESVPYKAFDQIADALSAHLATIPDEEILELIPQEAALLTTLFPVLARVSAFSRLASKKSPADPTELRLRGVAGFRELLDRLSRRHRLVLVIDDVQWSDGDSALVFKELFTGPCPPPCLVLVTSRNPRPPALGSLFDSLEAQNFPGARVTELELGPLPDEEAKELARSVNPEGPRSALSTAVITEEAKGNPFFVLALTRGAQGERTSLPSFMQSWLASLPPIALKLLQIIAVAGRPLEEGIALGVLGKQDASEELFLLSAGHFIGAWPKPSSDVECYHDRIREAALGSLDPRTLRELHGRLGEVLEAHGGAEAERLATHFLAAGQLEKGSRYAERAADEASASFAFLHAAHWYERAQASTGRDPNRTASLARKLGEAYAGAGQGARAASFLLEAAETSGSREDSLRNKQRAAELLLVSGHIDAGVETLQEVLRHIRMRLAPTPKRALLSLIVQRGRLKMRGLSFSPRHTGETAQSELLKIDACWSVALGLSLVDPIRAADFQTRNLLLSLKCGDSYRVARALAMEAGFQSAGGSKTEQRARELSAQAQRLADDLGNSHAIGLSRFTAGLGEYLRGNWKEACELLDEAEKLLVHVPGAIWELNGSQRFHLNALIFMGDIRTIAARTPNLVKYARERGNLYAECALRVRLSSLIWRVQDDPSRATSEVEDVMKRWSQEGFHLQHYSEFYSLVLSDLYRGDVREAMDRTRTTWPKLKSSLLTNTQALRIESTHVRTRICLGVLSNDPNDKESAALLKSDIAALRKEKAHWASAYATFAEALGHARSKPERAASGLILAREQLESGHMLLMAAVCDFCLGRIQGGDEGASLIETARDFMTAQGIKNPDCFAQHCGPLPQNQS